MCTAANLIRPRVVKACPGDSNHWCQIPRRSNHNVLWKIHFKKPQAFQTASAVTLDACASLQNSLIPCTDIARVQIPDGKLISQCGWIEFPILYCTAWRLFCSAVEEVRAGRHSPSLKSSTSFIQDTHWKGHHWLVTAIKKFYHTISEIFFLKKCYHHMLLPFPVP